MKPTTPAEALGLAIHFAVHDGHSGDGCCSYLETDLADGRELIEGLAALGWLPPSPKVSLPTEVPAGEPRTASRNVADLSDRQWAVWQLVSDAGDRGMTSVELNARYAGLPPSVYPPMKPDSPRKRLPELERAGHLIRTDELRDGAHVWRATEWNTYRVAS